MSGLAPLLSRLTRAGLVFCAFFLVLLALYVSLGRQLLPLVAEYRSEAQAEASQALGMPISIGSLEGHWSGLAPVVLARDVMIGEGATALRLDQVQVVADFWASLRHAQLRLRSVQLSGLQINLLEDSDGQWHLKGFADDTSAPTDLPQVIEQLQRVASLSLLDSQLTLEPQGRSPMTLTYVAATLRTGPAQQGLDLRLTLPDGQPVALSVKGRVPGNDWRALQAQSYISLPQTDWQRWLPPQWAAGWKLQQVQGGGELWLDWAEGKLQRAVARLNAPLVRAAYADRKPTKIEDLALNAWVNRSGDGLEATVDSLAMTLGKTRWETQARVRQIPVSDTLGTTWQLQANRVDLNPLTAVIDALVPLPKTAAAVVDGLKVSGGLRNLTLAYRPDAEGDQRLTFAANLDQVGFNAYHGAPAAGNVSGSISGDLGHGELRLDSDDFMLHLFPIFDKPWRYRHANARLNWRLDADQFTLIAPYIKVLGDEGKIAADFLIRLPLDPAQEGYMDLRVGMVDGDGRYTAKYLPTELSPALDEWLRESIKQGEVEQGYFQYQGSLAKSAGEHSRSISLFFKVHDAQLAFQPGWPELSKVDGSVWVQDGNVRVEASKGQVLDTQLKNVKVSVPHAPDGEPSHLYINGDFAGSLSDGLKFLQQAPIGTESIFAGWQGEGPLNGGLKLDIPLVKGQAAKVVVDFKTNNARLKIKDPALELTQLKGDFRFDLDKGLSGSGIVAQAFDRPVTAQIAAEGKPGSPLTRVNAQGQIGVKRLADWLSVNQKLPVSGDLPYRLQLLLGADNQLMIDSNLQGAAVDLPAPYGKAADDVRPSQFRMTLQGAERQFDFSYAGLANFTYLAPANKLAEGRGELFLGQGSAQLPTAPGLRVRAVVDRLELDPWKTWVDQYSGTGTGTGTGTAAAAAPQPPAMLKEVDLQAGQLTGFGVTLDQADLQLKRAATAWNLQVDSQQVVGNVSLPDQAGAAIVVDLQTVRLPAPEPAPPTAEAGDGEDPLASVDPRKVPAVDLKIQRLMLGDQLVGAWSVKARPSGNGLALNDLDLGLKGLKLKGRAGWEGAPGASNSWYSGRMEGGNLADVLQAWGFAPTVTSESFTLDADGRWPGSPAWVGVKRYSGLLDASLRNGRFVEVEGGAQALRVFGLLNFNSIGRRLRLDFTDLFGKGLSYDRVKGLLAAKNGVYVTQVPISLTGPSSNFELNGTLDMVKDQVDARLQVSLPIASNLPLAALIVGFPAVGGALFLVDKLLGDRVAKFASVQYRVEGPWKEPKISLDKPFDK